MKTLIEFDRALSRHDWAYEFSDDTRVYDQGRRAEERLRSLAGTAPEWRRLFDAYATVYSWISPPPEAQKELHALRQSLGLPALP